MVCIPVALILFILSLRFESTHTSAQELIGSRSEDGQLQLLKEKLQRMDHEHLRKAKLDEFVINKRKTFVVTPAFDMDIKTNKISTPTEPVIRFTEILDDGVVRNELSTVKHENNIAIGKVDRATKAGDYDVKNGYRATILPLVNKNIQTVESPQVPMINVLEKQNEMIEKLVALYQEELKRNRNSKGKMSRNLNVLREDPGVPSQSKETDAPINNKENITDTKYTGLQASYETIKEINETTIKKTNLLQDVTEVDTEEQNPTEDPEKGSQAEEYTKDTPDKEKADEENTEDTPDKEKADEENTEDTPDKEKADEENTEDTPDKEKADEENTEDTPDKEKADEQNTEDTPDKEKSNEEKAQNGENEQNDDNSKEKNTTKTETLTTKTTTTTTKTRKRLKYTFDRIEIIKALRENPWLSDIVRKANEDKLEYFRKSEIDQKFKRMGWWD